MAVKLNWKRTIIVGLAFMSISAFWQVYDNAIPLILKNTYGLSEGVTGIIMGIDNVLAIFLMPVFGALSDKTSTRIGRRTPYILVGTAITVVSMMILPLLDNHGKSTFWLFMGVLFIVLLALSSYRSPAVAYMPDITPKPLRSKGNGVINLMGALGSVVILALTGILVVPNATNPEKPNYFFLFLFLAVFMVVTVLVLFFTINENKAVAEMRKQSAAMGIDAEEVEDADHVHASVKMAPDVRKSFALILVSIFLWFMGYNAITSSFTRYAEDMWSKDIGQASRILMVATISAVIFFIPVGFLATRLGRKRTILIGIVMLAAGFGTAFLYNGFNPLLYVNFIIVGIGWAFINVNSLPMVVDMCKGAEVGKYTGYYYIASMSAQIITPALSGFLVDTTTWGWQILFPYSCFFVLLAFVTMAMVKHGDTKPQQPVKGMEAFDVDD